MQLWDSKAAEAFLLASVSARCVVKNQGWEVGQSLSACLENMRTDIQSQIVQKPGMVMHACNTSSREAETVDLGGGVMISQSRLRVRPRPVRDRLRKPSGRYLGNNT